MVKTNRVVIHGDVQGVGFRSIIRSAAMRLHLNGYTRNLPDGTVEALVTGSPAAVQEFIRWVSGTPDGIRVERVEVKNAADTRSRGFIILQ